MAAPPERSGPAAPASAAEAQGKITSFRTISTRADVPQGLRSIGSVAAELVADLIFRRRVETIHAFGPRVMAELLAEIGATHSIQLDIDRRLSRYAALDPCHLESLGGNQMPPEPMHEVVS